MSDAIWQKIHEVAETEVQSDQKLGWTELRFGYLTVGDGAGTLIPDTVSYPREVWVRDDNNNRFKAVLPPSILIPYQNNTDLENVTVQYGKPPKSDILTIHNVFTGDGLAAMGSQDPTTQLISNTYLAPYILQSANSAYPNAQSLGSLSLPGAGGLVYDTISAGPTGSLSIIANGALGQPLLAGSTAPAYGALNLAGGSSIVTGITPLLNGGSGADLSATGGAHKIVFQETLGGAFTVRVLASSDVPSGAGSPLSAKGDLYTFSTVNTRQPAGADYSVPIWDSSQTTGIIASSSATSALQLPVGTTLQQPGSPSAGMIRYNSTTGRFEFYTTAWRNYVRLDGDTMTGDLTVTNLIITNGDVIAPTVDGVTAIKFTKANKTTEIARIDTTNNRIGIGNVAPGATLHVLGAASGKTSIFQANATTPGNIMEWQDSGSNVLASVDSGGRFGVGTAPVSGRMINVLINSSTVTTPQTGINVLGTLTQTTSGNFSDVAFQATMQVQANSGVTNTNIQSGFLGGSNVGSSHAGTYQALYGLNSRNTIRAGAAGFVTSFIGVYALLTDSGANTLAITEYDGFYADAPGATIDGTTITTSNGMNIQNHGGTNISTSYGIHLADQTGSSVATWGIFTGKGINQLGDQLTIKGSSDRPQLIVKANGTQSSANGLLHLQSSSGSNYTVFNNVGLASIYNSDTTSGNGLSSIVGSISLTGQTASISATNIFTPPANGMYEASFYLEDTTTSTSGGTVFASIIYTDDNGSQTQSTATIVLSATGFTSNVFTFFAKTSAAIQYSTTVGGVIVGSPQYAVRVILKRLS